MIKRFMFELRWSFYEVYRYIPAEVGGFAFVIQILSLAKKNVFIFAFLCFRC